MMYAKWQRIVSILYFVKLEFKAFGLVMSDCLFSFLQKGFYVSLTVLSCAIKGCSLLNLLDHCLLFIGWNVLARTLEKLMFMM